MKGVTDLNFALFAGNEQHCTRKIADYSNCCGLKLKGWGGALGAKCSSDDKDLAVTRRIKLRHLVQNYFAYFSPITKQDRAASMISFVIVVMQLTFMILVACLITLSTNLKLPFVILKIVDITS